MKKRVPAEKAAASAKVTLKLMGVAVGFIGVLMVVALGFGIAATASADRPVVLGVSIPLLLLVGGALAFAFFFPVARVWRKPLAFYLAMEAQRPNAVLVMCGGSAGLARTLSAMAAGQRVRAFNFIVAIADDSGLEFWAARSPEHSLVRFDWDEVQGARADRIAVGRVDCPGLVFVVSADGAVHELPLAVSSVRDGTLAGATEDEMAALAEQIGGMRGKAASADR